MVVASPERICQRTWLEYEAKSSSPHADHVSLEEFKKPGEMEITSEAAGVLRLEGWALD